jgi:metallophosphoesterase (TIGR00282 family)
MSLIKLLFIGDVVGDNGLDFLVKHLPELKHKYQYDSLVVNAENVWNGKGLNESEAKILFNAGANVLTTGNHIWDNWKSRPLLATNDKVLRPLNYPSGNPGKGYTYFVSKDNVEICVLQLQGRTYMQSIDCPFHAADYALRAIRERTQNIIVDIHAESTAEKIALANYLDGRVSAIFGTHTHVQTADAQIMPKGTGYISDVGMTGPYDSVLGMKTDIAIKRFTLQTAHKYELAEADFKIAGCFVMIDSYSGQTLNIESFMFPSFVRNV